MILTCPACATRYQADEANFPPEGRKVRCAKCAHIWHQAAAKAPEPDVATLGPEMPAPLPPPARAFAPLGAAREEAREPVAWGALLAVGAGWAALVLVVLAIGYAAVRYRQEIAMLWPQSAGVYSSLGLKVSASGIGFTHVAYRRESEDGEAVLAVTGTIVNEGTLELPVPQNVRVSLSDAGNHEIYHWNFTPGVARLKPGQSAPFVTRLSNPPPTAIHLEVRFAPNG